jgi:hypothetical protein
MARAAKFVLDELLGQLLILATYKLFDLRVVAT